MYGSVELKFISEVLASGRCNITESSTDIAAQLSARLALEVESTGGAEYRSLKASHTNTAGVSIEAEAGGKWKTTRVLAIPGIPPVWHRVLDIALPYFAPQLAAINFLVTQDSNIEFGLGYSVGAYVKDETTFGAGGADLTLGAQLSAGWSLGGGGKFNKSYEDGVLKVGGTADAAVIAGFKTNFKLEVDTNKFYDSMLDVGDFAQNDMRAFLESDVPDFFSNDVKDFILNDAKDFFTNDVVNLWRSLSFAREVEQAEVDVANKLADAAVNAYNAVGDWLGLW